MPFCCLLNWLEPDFPSANTAIMATFLSTTVSQSFFFLCGGGWMLCQYLLGAAGLHIPFLRELYITSNLLSMRLSISWRTNLKGTQAWDNLDFFIPKSNPYMPLVNFQKKFRFFCFDFCQDFDVRTFPRWLSIRGTKFFWWAIQKFFFFKIFNLVLLDGFLDGFWKFRFLIVKICILICYFWVFRKL